MPMSQNRDRFNKVIAVAVNPGAYEDEAIAALRKARALVKEDPSLAHPAPAPETHVPKPPAPEASIQTQITNIPQFWQPIVMTNLSAEAYGLGLRSKIEIEFAQSSTYKLNVRGDGSKPACEAFQAHINWLIQYINTQPAQPR
jgi:hypothetical protein